MENNFNKFRKSRIGGFNRKDVIDYIEKIQNEFFDYKKETDETVKKLREKIVELENLTENNNGTVALQDETSGITVENNDDKSETSAADEITLATHKLRDVTDELCNSLNDFIDRLSENSIPVVLNIPVEENILEETDEIEQCEAPEKVLSKAESILATVSSIFVDSDSAENASDKSADVNKNSYVKKDVNSILDKAGFFC